MNRGRATLAVTALILTTASVGSLAAASVTSPASPASAHAAESSHHKVHRPHDAVVFSDDKGTGHFQLYIARSNGRVRQLTHLPRGKNAYQPDWSPDGSHVAFTVESRVNDEIYTIRADGEHLRRLTHNADHSSAQPRWSPDGTKFVFERSKPHGHCDVGHSNALYFCHLWIMHSDGLHAHALPADPHFDDFDPAWSPNGNLIAFDSQRGGLMSAVWVMRMDGTQRRQLTRPAAVAGWPAWSPSSKRIAFTNLTENGGLFTIGRVGRHLKVLAEAGKSAHDYPSWAGERIAFATHTKVGTNIVSVLADGRRRHVIVRGVRSPTPFFDYRVN